MPQKKIAYLTWGCASQITSFQDFANQLDDMIYLRELETVTISAAMPRWCVPDGTDSAGIRRYAAQLNAYVRNGGFLIIFGAKGVHEWIDVVKLGWRDDRCQGLAVVDEAQSLSRDPPARAEASALRDDLAQPT